MDTVPWNLRWPFRASEGGGLSLVLGGTQSRCASENPPISWSDMALQSSRDSALSNFNIGKGLTWLRVPSAVKAVALN